MPFSTYRIFFWCEIKQNLHLNENKFSNLSSRMDAYNMTNFLLWCKWIHYLLFIIFVVIAIVVSERSFILLFSGSMQQIICDNSDNKAIVKISTAMYGLLLHSLYICFLSYKAYEWYYLWIANNLHAPLNHREIANKSE